MTKIKKTGSLIGFTILAGTAITVIPLLIVFGKQTPSPNTPDETLTFEKIANIDFLQPHEAMTITGGGRTDDVITKVSNLYETFSAIQEAILFTVWSKFDPTGIDSWKTDWTGLGLGTLELSIHSIVDWSWKIVSTEDQYGMRTTSNSRVEKISFSTRLEVQISNMELWNNVSWSPSNGGFVAPFEPYLSQITFNIPETLEMYK